MPLPRARSITAMRPICARPGPISTNRPVPAGTPSSTASACTAPDESCSSTSREGGTFCSPTNTVQRRRRQARSPAWSSARRTWTIARAPQQALAGDQEQDHCQPQEQEESDHVARGEAAQLVRHVDAAEEVPGGLGELEHGEHGARDRGSRDQARAEENAGAALRLGLADRALLAAVDQPAHDASHHDRRGGGDRQVHAHGEGQRRQPAQLEDDADEDPDQHQPPGELLGHDALDDEDISTGLGAENLEVTFSPLSRWVSCPLMPGSSRYLTRPVSSTRYFPGGIGPRGSRRRTTLYSAPSRSASGPRKRSRPSYSKGANLTWG